MIAIAPESIDFSSLPSMCLEQKSNLPNISGVYFVFVSERILYIGRAANLQRRWRQHHRQLEFEGFNEARIAWLHVSDSQILPAIEKALIQYFKPLLNQRSIKARKPKGLPGNPYGNPDFGTKYKFDNGREKPLSEQIKVLVYPETKLYLKGIADKKNCTVPDLVRAAIEKYIVKISGEGGMSNIT